MQLVEQWPAAERLGRQNCRAYSVDAARASASFPRHRRSGAASAALRSVAVASTALVPFFASKVREVLVAFVCTTNQSSSRRKGGGARSGCSCHAVTGAPSVAGAPAAGRKTVRGCTGRSDARDRGWCSAGTSAAGEEGSRQS